MQYEYIKISLLNPFITKVCVDLLQGQALMSEVLLIQVYVQKEHTVPRLEQTASEWTLGSNLQPVQYRDGKEKREKRTRSTPHSTLRKELQPLVPGEEQQTDSAFGMAVEHHSSFLRPRSRASAYHTGQPSVLLVVFIQCRCLWKLS